MGQEPLFHARTPDGLILACNWPHALRAVPGLDSDPDPAAIRAWMITRTRVMSSTRADSFSGVVPTCPGSRA